MRRAALLLTFAALLAVPAAAAGQAGPFGPLPPPAPQATPVPEPADDGDGDGGDISRTTLALVGLGVLASFFGIGWAITRDARRSLTERDRESLERGPGAQDPERTRAGRAAAKRKARQRAKMQRAARRRNR